MVGTAIGIAAWGLITGVAMGNSGLGVPLMVFMSLAVFAGSAQLAVLPLLSSGAPIWVVWATALCVNLRFVIFSAMWRPYLMGQSLGVRLRVAYVTADLNYVLFMRRFRNQSPGTTAVFLGRRGRLGGLAAAFDRRHRARRFGARALGLRLCRHAGADGAGTGAADRPYRRGRLRRRGGVCHAAEAQHPGGDCRCRGHRLADGPRYTRPPSAAEDRT
jgi:hypothetical protein